MLRLAMHTSAIFNSQHVATRCNKVTKRVQHVAPDNVAICCVQNVGIVLPELANAGPTMLGYVALKCCDRLAGALNSSGANALSVISAFP